MLIISLLFYSYAFDIKTCQGKLNIAYDTLQPSTLSPAFTKQTPTPKFDSYPLNILNYQTILSKNLTTTIEKTPKKQEDQCGHIITTYVLPSIMHLIAYIIGFIYFRINDNEQLYALMEKVFLAVNVTLKTVSQDRVIRRLK